MGTKIKNIKQNKNKEYGLLSMMAMIIGIVIGSGIFIKNTDLINVTGDISSVFWLWVLGGILIMAMVVAFLEIISITESSGDRSTLPNWGRILVNEKFGKFIGYYLTFIYFPILIASATRFGSKQFLETLTISGAFDFASISPVLFSFFLLIISVLFLLVIGIMNTLRNKPGKYFQNVGTCLKTIPLFFIILLFFFIIVSNFSDISFDKDASIQQDPIYSSVKSNNILLIFLALPSILFAFDGFLSAGSLSKEAKGKNTFKIAFVSSMIFIVIIYFVFSMATLGLGDPTTSVPNSPDDKIPYGSIDNVLYTVFKTSVARILSPTISFIIIISILTNISGNFIASTRMLSDLSETNSIVETKYIEINKYGAPQNSGFRMLTLTAGWLIILASFDAFIVCLTSLVMSESVNDIHSSLVITGFVSNLIVIGIFSICAIIILFAIINRFKDNDKQVATKKNKLFIPASCIAIIMIFITTAFTLFSSFVPITVLGSAKWEEPEWIIYISELVFTAFFFVYIALLSLFHLNKTKKLLD